MKPTKESMIRTLLLFLNKAEQAKVDILPPEHLLAAVKLHGFNCTKTE